MARAIAYDRDRPLTPEVVDPRLADVEKLARVMDEALPIGGGIPIGLDGLLGLIPGIGDAITALISLYIVWRAVQLGVPRVTLVRMVANIGIDSAVGAVPILGDVFDFAWKSNMKNYHLMQSHLSTPHRQVRRDWAFVIAIIVAVFVIIGLMVIGLMTLINRPLF